MYVKSSDMTTPDNIKNNLISSIMASRNEKLLNVVKNIFDSTAESDIVSLSPHKSKCL